jgi:hypothetical protein
MRCSRTPPNNSTRWGRLSERSNALGHQLVSWISHNEEYISWCEHCGARDLRADRR